jgi:hypothetical protein
MFVEMSCNCGATLQLDGFEETSTLLMANRFSEAHTVCGYVTPINGDTQDKTSRYELKFKPKQRIKHEDEED